MKHLTNFFIGMILSVVGLLMFLNNITVTNGANSQIMNMFNSILGGSQTSAKTSSGILFVLIGVTFFIFVIKPNIFTGALFILSLLILVFSLVGGMQVRLADMSGTDIFITFAMFFSGIALMIKSYGTLMFPAKQ